MKLLGVKSWAIVCSVCVWVSEVSGDALRMTVPLVSYIRNSLRFWYYASLSTCCQNLEKKLGSLGKFGRKRGQTFKGSDPEKCQF